jgi:hypothetical protein
MTEIRAGTASTPHVIVLSPYGNLELSLISLPEVSFVVIVYQYSHCRKPVVPLPDWRQGQAHSMLPIDSFERFPRQAVGFQVRPRR